MNSTAAPKCVQIGSATLYLGDCRDVLPTLAKVDLCLTDPPYGIGKDGTKISTSSHGGTKAYAFLGWDNERPSKEVFDMLLSSAKTQIIWGGNYFADLLPPSGKWLSWDKGQRIDQADAELAWTSMDSALRVYTLNRAALVADGPCHPTQKPVKLMKWCIKQSGEPKSILDPFMGSGSTGVAALEMGLGFIGIERESEYFEIACERLRRAHAQPDMFVVKTEPEQPGLI